MAPRRVWPISAHQQKAHKATLSIYSYYYDRTPVRAGIFALNSSTATPRHATKWNFYSLNRRETPGYRITPGILSYVCAVCVCLCICLCVCEPVSYLHTCFRLSTIIYPLIWLLAIPVAIVFLHLTRHLSLFSSLPLLPLIAAKMSSTGDDIRDEERPSIPSHVFGFTYTLHYTRFCFLTLISLPFNTFIFFKLIQCTAGSKNVDIL